MPFFKEITADDPRRGHTGVAAATAPHYASRMLSNGVKNAKPYWCVAFAEELPDAFTDGLVLSEGFTDDAPDEIPPDQITYAVLCRTVASSEDEAHASIMTSLQEVSLPTPCPLVTIDADSLILRRREWRAVSDLAHGDTAIHSSVIGFKRGNAEAQEASLRIIRESMSKKRWEFWR